MLFDDLEPMEATGIVDEHDPDDDVLATDDASASLEAQPVPSDSSCPYCGGDAAPADAVAHRLSAMGYTHDDIEMQCVECDATWPHGVPIGEFEGENADRLFCSSCEKRFMRVHRVVPDWNRYPDRVRVMLHCKCPNCYYFEKQQRECGSDGKALVGYPDITGSVANASGAEGYPDRETDDNDDSI